MQVSTKKIVLCSILACLALIAFTIESLFPPLFVPGARMGISNIFILITLIVFGVGEAFIVTLVKIVLGSLITGNVSAMMYSLPAGIISLGVEFILLYAKPKFSVIAISVLGAVLNGAVQNLMFYIITTNISVLTYLPYLSLISAISGAIIGISVWLIIKYLPFERFFNDLNAKH